MKLEAPVQARPTRYARTKLLAILFLCALPVIASYITYYFIRPDGRRNTGDIIDPQVPMPDLTARSLDGKNVKLQTLRKQWLLISVAAAACDGNCQHNLYLQRQLREGLGKDKDRMDWIWLVNDEAPVADNMLATLTGATILRLPAAQIAQWLQPSAGQALESHLYLVDPIGNWMMRFKPNMDIQGAKKARADMERLMRATSFWDREGR